MKNISLRHSTNDSAAGTQKDGKWQQQKKGKKKERRLQKEIKEDKIWI